MIRRFALEPSVASDRMALVAFVQGLGIENGRVLSEFPRAWTRLALAEARSTLPLRDRKRLEELVIRISTDGLAKVKSGLPFDGQRSWLDNAILQVAGFDAVIHADDSPCPVSHDSVHSASSLLEAPPFWQVDRRVTFVPTRGALAALLKPLLELDRSVAIMDPFFNPTQTRYLKGLAEIVAALQPATSLVVHSSAEVSAGNRLLATPDWDAACRAMPSEIIDHPRSLEVVRWGRGHGVGRPHDRWVITPRGGIELGRGIAVGSERNSAALMPARAAAELWEAFGGTAFSGVGYDQRDVVRVR